MERFSALIGFFLILAIAFVLSTDRKAIKWRTVTWGLILQISVAVLKGELIAQSLSAIALPLTRAGAAFVFIIAAIVATQVAKRIAPGARKGIWIAFLARFKVFDSDGNVRGGR